MNPTNGMGPTQSTGSAFPTFKANIAEYAGKVWTWITNNVSNIVKQIAQITQILPNAVSFDFDLEKNEASLNLKNIQPQTKDGNQTSQSQTSSKTDDVAQNKMPGKQTRNQADKTPNHVDMFRIAMFNESSSRSPVEPNKRGNRKSPTASSNKTNGKAKELSPKGEKNDEVVPHSQHVVKQMPSDNSCQLWSILEGMKIKHPKLLQSALTILQEGCPGEAEPKSVTVHDLRKITCDFLEEQLRSTVKNADLASYIETDRNDYNDTDKHCPGHKKLKDDCNKVLGPINKELQELEFRFKVKERFKAQVDSAKAKLDAGKITKDECSQAMKAAIKTKNELLKKGELNEAEYNKLTAPLLKMKAELEKNLAEALKKAEENGGITSDKAYIDKSRDRHFWLGNAHLHAISAIFGLPIHVYEHSLSDKLPPVVFNATKANETAVAPLKIIRVGQTHYNLILN